MIYIKSRLLNYEILITFILSSTALAFAPGPDNIYVLTQSLVHGKKYGLSTVAGLVSGCIIHTTLLAFGVSAIIKNNDTLFFIIKLFGAVYLFFLAFKVIRSNGEISLSENGPVKNGMFRLFKQGFIMNVLNPKVTIFFLAFFPSFLFSETRSHAFQFYVLGLLFMVVTFLVFGSIALLAGRISVLIKKYNKVGILLKWMQVIVFIGLAIFILLSNK